MVRGAPRYTPRWPSVVMWILAAALGVGALLGLGYLVGRRDPSPSDQPLDAVLAALAQPTVAAIAALAAITLIAWSVSQLWLEWLAFKPGRIVVAELSGGPGFEDTDLGELTMQLRRHLTSSLALCLAGRSFEPVAPARLEEGLSSGEATEGSFLDVLGGGVDPSGSFGSMLRLLRAASPRHAYEVKGSLVKRTQPPSYGVTLQVIRLPGQASPPFTVWDGTWAAALKRAADHSIGSILPRTRLCLPPWSEWRGRPMPGTLLEAFHRAAELEGQRRYDEALARYYEILARDPRNLDVRLQIGIVLEKINAQLAAFATYQGILATAEAEMRVAFRRRGRRWRQRPVLVARYRRAALMARAGFVEQWLSVGSSDPAERKESDRHRRELRERLREGLLQSLDPLGTSRRRGDRSIARVGRRATTALLDEPPRDLSHDNPHKGELEEVLLIAAANEFSELRRVLRRSRRNLKAGTVALSEVWTRQRLRFVQAELHQVTPNWDPAFPELERAVKSVTPRIGLRSWQENYHAARVYALPLVGRSPSEPWAEGEDRLARAAVAHLARIVHEPAAPRAFRGAVLSG